MTPEGPGASGATAGYSPLPADGSVWAGTGGGRGSRVSRELSVAQLNGLVRELIEGSVPPLWVSGEVTGWKRYPNGHCYFALRDGDAQLRCVMFRTSAQRLPTDPGEGTAVRAFGTASLYEKRGEFQFIVQELEGRAAGGLWRLAFERLRARLDEQGLLSPARKRPLPPFPSAIGVVTSPVGAALHDILHILERRAPWTRVVFCPARVQGDGAAEDIAAAIRRLGQHGGIDLMIVGRGGGSVEDLWGFNEEAVARAIAAAPVPVISAVGHEVDVTIADLVADLRAPTPSAAAELAVPDRAEIEKRLAWLASRLEPAARRTVDTRRDETARQLARMTTAARRHLQRRSDELAGLSGRLDALSPLAALRRGYAVPQHAEGHVLRKLADFQLGGRFRLRVVDGVVHGLVEDRVSYDERGNAS